MDNKPQEPIHSRVELNREKHNKKKKVHIIIGIVLFLFLGLGIYASSVYLKAKNAFDKRQNGRQAG